MTVSTIASCGRSCRNLFERLCSIWSSADPTTTGQVSLPSIRTESDRYNLWANNIAALQDAYLPTSLDYRIREDASARSVVEKALRYLEESLILALEIVSGERPNETWEETALSKSKAGETETKSSSEIFELYLSIEEAISNLFRLSMIIRKKPERDEYAKAATRYQIDPTSDIVHVRDKYPTAKNLELPWLMKRFGISITQRRQYLLYRREHQQRMGEAHRLKAAPDGNTLWSGTKASTYLPDGDDVIDPQGHVLPVKIILEPSQKRPQTVYADSSRGKDGATDYLRTPLLPIRQDGSRTNHGEHFECPYCWRVQKVANKNEWKKHVLSDLKPYICTFQLCELNMFDSQHDWFTHELQIHRKQWRCSLCEMRACESRPDLIVHLETDHQKQLNGQSADVFVESCQVERIDASECPLCTEYGEKLQKVNESPKCDVSLKQFQQHLGLHMQQLALAALPQDITEEGDDEADSDSDIETIRHQLDLDIDQISDSGSAVYALDELDELPAEQRDLYGILGLERHATQLEIREAYILSDPLRYIKERPNDPSALQQYRNMSRAYGILKDPKLRSQFDLKTRACENSNAMKPEFKNPYDILGIDQNASLGVIEHVTQTFGEYESDIHTGEIITNPMFAEVNWAYEQLRNPTLRSIWDEKIATHNGSSANNRPPKKQYNNGGTENEDVIGANISATAISVEDGDQSRQYISFVDAVGRRFKYPFELCKTIAGMDDLIRQAFLHVDSLTAEVNRRRYDLLGSDGKVIEREQWDKMVLPGSTITMRMWPMLPTFSEVEWMQAFAHKAEEEGWEPVQILNASPPPPPSWAKDLVRDFCLHYPNCRIDCIMASRAIDIFTLHPTEEDFDVDAPPSHIKQMYIPRLRCEDCPGKLYIFGPGRTTEWFEVHLQNAWHVKHIRERLDASDVKDPESRA